MTFSIFSDPAYAPLIGSLRFGDRERSFERLRAGEVLDPDAGFALFDRIAGNPLAGQLPFHELVDGQRDLPFRCGRQPNPLAPLNVSHDPYRLHQSAFELQVEIGEAVHASNHLHAPFAPLGDVRVDDLELAEKRFIKSPITLSPDQWAMSHPETIRQYRREERRDRDLRQIPPSSRTPNSRQSTPKTPPVRTWPEITSQNHYSRLNLIGETTSALLHEDAASEDSESQLGSEYVVRIRCLELIRCRSQQTK